MLLLRGTAFSIVLETNVEGTFSGELKGLTLRQAMDAVVRPQGLDYTVDDNVIAVHRRKPAMRLFDVSYLNVRREWQRTIRSGSADLSSSIGGSYFDEIEAGVAALLSSEGRAHVDRRNGVVQVTDFQERLDRVATYLETVHARALRQVRLSARIVEVTLHDPSAQAVDWKAVADHSRQPWSAINPTAGVRVEDFSAILKALAAQGSVRTLASPHVLAMNNEPAVMRVGTREVDFTPAKVSDATPLGFTMTITPHIDAGGMIHLSVSPSYAEKTVEARADAGERIPVVSFADADTVLRMHDGESILLAGLLQRKDTVRSELVILLSATIVTAGPRGQTGTR